jgi:hypothetical protein
LATGATPAAPVVIAVFRVGGATDRGNDLAGFLQDTPSSAGRDLDTYFPAYRDT